MPPRLHAVILPVALVSCSACSDGALPPSRSPDDPSNANAAEAPFAAPSGSALAGVRAPTAAPPAPSGTMQPMQHAMPPGSGGAK